MGIFERLFLSFTAFCCKTKTRTILINGGFLGILLFSFYQRDLILYYVQRTTYTYEFDVAMRVVIGIKFFACFLALLSIGIMLLIFIFSILFDVKYLFRSRTNENCDGLYLTIVVPCYNEGAKLPKTIQRLMRLKSLSKTHITIVFVNDGSTDYDEETIMKIKDVEEKNKKFQTMIENKYRYTKEMFQDIMRYYSSLESVDEIKNNSTCETMKVLKEHFPNAEKTELKEIYGLLHKPVKTVYYDATNDVYIVDKSNGGKFDALNTGINLCKTKWVLVLDADTIIGDNTIDKCLSHADENTEIVYPPIIPMYKKKNVVTISQLFNYLSSFFIVRQGMALYNGNVIVSGAVGFFTIDFLTETNGYYETVGEDAHKTLDFHFRNLVRFVNNVKSKKMLFIPDADACFTFAFEEVKGLNKQQNRWMRALLQVMDYMQKITHIRNKKKIMNEHKAKRVKLQGEGKRRLRDGLCMKLLKLSHLYYNLIEIIMQFTMPFNIVVMTYLLITKQFSSLLLQVQILYFLIAIVYSATGLIKFALYQRKLAYLLYIPFTPFTIIFYALIYPSKIKAYIERKSLSWGR